jgi:hypothetical protein
LHNPRPETLFLVHSFAALTAALPAAALLSATLTAATLAAATLTALPAAALLTTTLPAALPATTLLGTTLATLSATLPALLRIQLRHVLVIKSGISTFTVLWIFHGKELLAETFGRETLRLFCESL